MPSDLAKLRWHLLAAVGSLAFAIALTYIAASGRQAAQAEHAAALSRYRQAETGLGEVHGEEIEIREKAGLFLRLQERGVVGPERRLDWSELLGDLGRRMHIPVVEYEFAPQKVMDGSARLTLRLSSMKLHLELLHEGDLLDFLGRLRQEAKAMLRVRNCKLARLPSGAAGRETALAQISADCSIDWITVQDSAGAKR